MSDRSFQQHHGPNGLVQDLRHLGSCKRHLSTSKIISNEFINTVNIYLYIHFIKILHINENTKESARINEKKKTIKCLLNKQESKIMIKR